MDRRSTGRSSAAQHRRMQTSSPMEQKRQSRPATTGDRQKAARPKTPPGPGYFTVELVMVFLWVAASLVFLPLVLPPLPPPPFLLLLLPVCLLAVLLALAFVPLDSHSNVVGSYCS